MTDKGFAEGDNAAPSVCLTANPLSVTTPPTKDRTYFSCYSLPSRVTNTSAQVSCHLLPGGEGFRTRIPSIKHRKDFALTRGKEELRFSRMKQKMIQARTTLLAAKPSPHGRRWRAAKKQSYLSFLCLKWFCRWNNS